ncbi:MAG: septal ring lytic transglycosylase RlpA family protein [Amphiplicatus sp.]
MIASMMRLCLAIGLFALLAACASTPVRDVGAPHYKVGAPYEVNGRTYTPREDPSYDAVGIASWYGEAFHGRRTANGEIFDKSRLSAAHTTLPMPSMVEVENLENGRRVVVRVNDRGPFVQDRLIDLSESAAKALGFDRAGLARVRVRYLGRADLYAMAPAYGAPEARRVAAAPRPASAPVPAPVVVSGMKPAARAPSPEPRPAPKIAPAAAPPAEYWINVAEYFDLHELQSARISLAGNGEMRVATRAIANGLFVYGLQIGPFYDANIASARLAGLREAGYPAASLAGDARCVANAPSDAVIAAC